MSKHVRFDGRGRLVAFDYELESGQAVEMTDEEAEQLAADPNVNVTVLSDEHEHESVTVPGDEHEHEPEADSARGASTGHTKKTKE